MVFIETLGTIVTNVAENIQTDPTCTDTSGLLMKTRNIPALRVIIKLHGRIILLNINSQYMKV